MAKKAPSVGIRSYNRLARNVGKFQTQFTAPGLHTDRAHSVRNSSSGVLLCCAAAYLPGASGSPSNSKFAMRKIPYVAGSSRVANVSKHGNSQNKVNKMLLELERCICLHSPPKLFGSTEPAFESRRNLPSLITRPRGLPRFAINQSAEEENAHRSEDSHSRTNICN